MIVGPCVVAADEGAGAAAGAESLYKRGAPTPCGMGAPPSVGCERSFAQVRWGLCAVEPHEGLLEVRNYVFLSIFMNFVTIRFVSIF